MAVRSFQLGTPETALTYYLGAAAPQTSRQPLPLPQSSLSRGGGGGRIVIVLKYGSPISKLAKEMEGYVLFPRFSAKIRLHTGVGAVNFIQSQCKFLGMSFLPSLRN